MQIYNETLKSICSMRDDELIRFISTIAADKGITLPTLSKTDVSKIKALLGGAGRGDPEISDALGKAFSNIYKGTK